MSQPELIRPQTVEDAVRILAEVGDDGRVLSGGATLVAMMNARLVEARVLVSLSAIPELAEARCLPDGTIRIGAMRRHRQTAEGSDLIDGQQVVARAAAQIANPTVRNMGTIGGSVSFADPAADYPPALVAADARVEIAGPDGRREVSAEDFFHGWYMTDLAPGEIVSAVLVPPAASGSVGHYEKLARVAGDFALVSVAVNLSLAQDGTIEAMRMAIGGCGGGPIRVPEAEVALLGTDPDAASLGDVDALIKQALDPVDDVRGSAEYRLQVAPRLVARALANAATPRMEEAS